MLASEAGSAAEFLPAVSFGAGDGPTFVAVGTLDGDDVDDLVVANAGSDDVSVLLGNGDGTFQAALFFAAGDGPASVAVGHFDGDTALDLVVANQGSDDVSVLLGNGDGTYQAATSYPSGDLTRSVAVGNLNGDAFLDIVAANALSGNVSVFLGNGDGTFQAATPFAAGGRPAAVAVANLDGDAFLDIAVVNQQSQTVSVLLGNGDGTFQPQLTFVTARAPLALAIANLDEDSILDIVTASQGDQVSVHLGNGDGTFQSGSLFAAGDFPRSVAVADLDCDSVVDLVTANANSDDASVLPGNGDATFQSAEFFSAGNTAASVAVADFDGNGVGDIVTANSVSDDVSVLLNLCDPTAGAVLSFGVEGGLPATETIDGLVVRPAEALEPAGPAIVFGNLDSSEDIDAYHVTGNGVVVFSTTTSVLLDGVIYGGADLIRWNGTTYSLYFDGTTLLGPGEGIDAVSILSPKQMLISTTTGASLYGFGFADGDVVLVDRMAQTAELFEGLDEATLFTGTNQNIDALHYDRESGKLMLSVLIDGQGTVAGVPYTTADDLFASVVRLDPAAPSAGELFVDGVGLYDGVTRQLDAFFMPTPAAPVPLFGPLGLGLVSAALCAIGGLAATRLR
jgi:hypothetical protein